MNHAPLAPGGQAGSQVFNSNGNGRTTSLRDVLVNAPRLSEEAWTAFKVQEIARTPAKRRPLVRFLLLKCGRKAVCWPSNKTIADELGYCQRTIDFYLAEVDGEGITQRLPVTSRSRRVIFFPAHPGYAETLTLVKESRKICASCRANSADHVAQKLRTKPLTVEDEKSNPLTNGNSREQDVGAGDEHGPRIEDGGTGGLKDLSEGTVNGKTGGPPERGVLAPLAQTVPSQEGNPPCPHCGRAVEIAGRNRSHPDGNGYMCPRCDLAWITPDSWKAACAMSHRATATSPEAPRLTPTVVVDVLPVPTPTPARKPQEELLDAVRSLSPGSTQEEIGKVTMRISRAIGDNHSYRYWSRVAQLVALGKIPTSVFVDVCGPDVGSPAKVINARVRRFVPDLWEKSFPKGLCGRLGEVTLHRG